MTFKTGKPNTGNLGDKFEAEALNGSLLVFIGRELMPDVATRFGSTDAVKIAFVGVIDGPEAGRVLRETLIFGMALVPALTPHEGDDVEVVIGRLGQATAKAGQSPAWVLIDPSDADLAVADEYLEANATRTKGGAIILEAPLGEAF